LSRSEEKAINYILKVKVEEVCLIIFEGEIEEESITLKGSLAFKDFGFEEGEFGGPFFKRVPKFIMGEEVEGGVIARGRVAICMWCMWWVIVGPGGGGEGGIVDGVAEVLGLVITLIIINLHGVRTEEAVTGGGVEGRDLVLIVINKVIKGFGIIGELEMVEVRAEAYEAVDDREVELGEVNADRVPVELIVLVVKEPLGREIKGVLGDWMTIVITGVGRGEFIEVGSGWEVGISQGWEGGGCGA
jgi:hypothetical protein